MAKSARSAHKQSEVNRKALEKAQRKKAKWDLEHRKSSAASIDAVARARNISIEEEKKERNAKRKRTTPVSSTINSFVVNSYYNVLGGLTFLSFHFF